MIEKIYIMQTATTSKLEWQYRIRQNRLIKQKNANGNSIIKWSTQQEAVTIINIYAPSSSTKIHKAK